MRYLGFGGRGGLVDGRRIRTMTFEDRSMLPVSAACVVASGVRETLSALFGETVVLKLYEPTIPQSAAWSAIVRDANVFRVHGAHADAAVIVRAQDALALAAAAFGECEARSGELSTLERTVLERIVRAIAKHVGPICGAAAEPAVDVSPDMRAFSTFFELQVERPVRARIGVALSRDPPPEARAGVAMEDLLDLDLPLSVQVDAGVHAAAEIGALEPGAVLPLPLGALRGTLLLAGRAVAIGECGVHGRYYALAIDRPPPGREDPDR